MPYTRAYSIILGMYSFLFMANTFLPLARLFFLWRDFFLLARLFLHWRDFFSAARLFFAGATFFAFSLALICRPLLDFIAGSSYEHV